MREAVVAEIGIVQRAMGFQIMVSSLFVLAGCLDEVWTGRERIDGDSGDDKMLKGEQGPARDDL